MSKKMKNNFWKEQEREYEAIKSKVSEFYDAYDVGELTFSSSASSFADLLKLEESALNQESFTEEEIEKREQQKQEMEDACLEILNNVNLAKPENLIISLDKRVQISHNPPLDLGDVVLKIVPLSAHKPIYIYSPAEDRMFARVYIGGNNVSAFFIVRDLHGEEHIIPLSEFHMLSLQKNPQRKKEVALMTSFLWMRARVYTSTILSYNLDPVKNLLMADFLREEWEKQKDARDNNVTAELGDELDEKE